MDILTRDELRLLTEQRGDFCISIFMPTHRAGDVQEDPIRFKNLLGRAQEKLVNAGARPAEARTLLEMVHRTVSGNLFWQERSDGLAMFISHPMFRYYRVPFRFEEQVVVGGRFMIKPLLPVVSGDLFFYILAISQNSVRFYKCTEFSCNEISLEGIVPRSRAEALKYDEFERQLRFHTSTASGVGTGRRAAIFHGQGYGVENIKTDILRYFQQVDRGLRQLLREEKSPLVFAGVDYLFPIYQEANSYQYLAGQSVTGNPETIGLDKIREAAFNIVKPVFQKSQENATSKFRELLGTGFASYDIAEIVPAAYYGRVGTLLLSLGPEQWGRFDLESNRVILNEKPVPGDQDLLDFAAVYTLTQNGTVFTVREPQVINSSPIGAMFRY